jgi:hypothetical protein
MSSPYLGTWGGSGWWDTEAVVRAWWNESAVSGVE